jgi:hypothetical protein
LWDKRERVAIVHGRVDHHPKPPWGRDDVVVHVALKERRIRIQHKFFAGENSRRAEKAAQENQNEPHTLSIGLVFGPLNSNRREGSQTNTRNSESYD